MPSLSRLALAVSLANAGLACGDGGSAAIDGGGTAEDEPCIGDNPGLGIDIEVGCCDAHNASLSIQLPGISEQLRYPIDTTGVVSGGTIAFTTAYPSAIESGDAEVYFYADGGGLFYFDETATVAIDPSACSRGGIVSMEKGGPPDGGT